MNKIRFGSRSGMIRIIFVLLALPGFAAAASAQSRVESRAIQSKILGRAVRYSVLLPPSFDYATARRYPVLYYLHGLGDNEQTLVNSGGWDLVEQLRESREIGEFLVVTPDGGRGFYINSHDGRERYEDFFIQEFIPEIERRYRAQGTRAARGISGTSMGGYGALRFAFRYPNLFVSVSAHMAALAENLSADLRAEFSGALGIFGKPFDERFWEENTPFTLARRAKGLKSLQIYFDCGQQDDLGLDRGALALHQLLQKLGIVHEFHLYPGGHNGRFVAAHFPASLRFHSRAFGLQK
jgi:S-formylglutathione hydrolase FrmB